MNATQLQKDEYIPYFNSYIQQAGAVDLVEGLLQGMDTMIAFYEAIGGDKLEYSYAEGKWTIKEIINHLIDSERVFCYRAMRFARYDKTVLSGFEENHYAEASKANGRSIASLLEEYRLVRLSTIALFSSFDNDMMLNKGVAGGGEVSVRALGFLIIGHEKHHGNVIKARYL